MHVERKLDGRLARRIELLARWWNEATQEARFKALKASCEGEPEAPPLQDLQYAIYLAEAESGQIESG